MSTFISQDVPTISRGNPQATVHGFQHIVGHAGWHSGMRNPTSPPEEDICQRNKAFGSAAPGPRRSEARGPGASKGGNCDPRHCDDDGRRSNPCFCEDAQGCGDMAEIETAKRALEDPDAPRAPERA
jgi:hypothetical protein